MLTRRELLAGVGAGALPAQSNRPNIVFVLSDDHHFQCLGDNGNPNIHTPNLDRLSQRGVNFRNGIISTAQCCPSRGILLSGLETYQSGLLSNGQTGFRAGLGPTVMEQLRRGGYDTALIGKWHIRPEPGDCGFGSAPLWLRGGGSRYVNPALRRGLDGKDTETPGHITDLFTDAAVDYLRSARKPFFLWLAYNAPHTPWHAEAKYRDPYAGRDPAKLAPSSHPPGGSKFDWVTYYAVITHLDEAVGRVTSELERAGLWNNTIVIFLGDNGYTCGTRGWNGKVHSWEESIRVPYFVTGGWIKGQRRVDAPAASIDLPRTWLDVAGIEPAYRIPGRSLRATLTGERDNNEAAFSTWDDGRDNALAVKQVIGPYRLVRTRQYKFVVWESHKQALYDWTKDPAEERNLIDDAGHRKTAAQLRERLEVRMKETDDHARSWLT